MRLRPGALLLISSLSCATVHPEQTLEEPVQLGVVAGHFRCVSGRWPRSLAELEQHTAGLNENAAPDETLYDIEWQGLEIPATVPEPSTPFLVYARQQRPWRAVSVDNPDCVTFDFHIVVDDAVQ